jgi:hypothetical protein
MSFTIINYRHYPVAFATKSDPDFGELVGRDILIDMGYHNNPRFVWIHWQGDYYILTPANPDTVIVIEGWCDHTRKTLNLTC